MVELSRKLVRWNRVCSRQYRSSSNKIVALVKSTITIKISTISIANPARRFDQRHGLNTRFTLTTYETVSRIRYDDTVAWKKDRMFNYTPQAAAIVVKGGNICIVSTSGGKGWVVPKGHLRRGIGLHETAAIEAWEEAGVKGKVIPEPVGEFTYKKKGESFHVTAFELKVSEISANWPEQDKRRRRWIRIDEAAGEVRYRQLGEVLASLASRNAGNSVSLQSPQILAKV